MPRVLVVGSESGPVDALGSALQDEGAAVDRAADTVGAAAAVDRGGYDCVVVSEPQEIDLEARLDEAGHDLPVLVADPDGDRSEVVDEVMRVADTRVFDRSLGRRKRLRTLFTDVRAELVDATDRDQIEELVCTRLATSGAYDAAWIGRWTDSVIEPSVGVGIDPSALRTVDPDHDDTAASRAAADWSRVVNDDEPHAVVALPLIGEDPLGILQISTHRSEGIPPGERELLTEMADAVATAIDRTAGAGASAPTGDEALRVLGDSFAHELGNQVDAARVQLELARERDDPEHFANVEAALSRLESVADDARALAGVTVEVTSCELASAAEAAWETIDARDAALSIDDGTIEADSTLLGLLLENLFRNAVEHGGDDVTVTVAPLEEGQFTVGDDGPGIATDDRDQVFEWGYSGGTGEGIGLAIVDLVADRHGWEVELEESDSGGAKFSFR